MAENINNIVNKIFETNEVKLALGIVFIVELKSLIPYLTSL